MVERIASFSPVPWTPAEPDEAELGSDDDEKVCRDPSQADDPPARGEAASRRSAGPPLPSPSETADAPKPPTNNNAQRTTARTEPGGYADAGVTSSGDSLYAGVAAIKSRGSDGVEVEVFSASAQVGGQSEGQLAMARVGYAGRNTSATVDALSARAQVGIHNDDGSVGFNAGALAVGAGAEATYTTDSGYSLTFGAAASVGAAVSIGIRDIDNDAYLEWCLKIGGTVFTVGLCVED